LYIGWSNKRVDESKCTVQLWKLERKRNGLNEVLYRRRNRVWQGKHTWVKITRVSASS